MNADSLGEEFHSLGTTPLEYEFDLREQAAAVCSPRAGGSVTRHFTGYSPAGAPMSAATFHAPSA
jgi:hypothetical protein